MRVTIFGARGSLPGAAPSQSTYGQATCCVSVVDGKAGLIFDAGSGIVSAGQALLDQGITTAHLFLSHIHLDHIIGLPFAPHLLQKGAKLHVYAPILNAPLSASLDTVFAPPFFPVTLDQLPGALVFERPDLSVGTDVGPFRVTATEVNHPGRAAGYRVETPTKTFAYVPDFEVRTAKETLSVEQVCKNADLALLDATYHPDERAAHEGWGHMDAVSCAQLARAACVRRFGLFHHQPTRSDVEIKQIEHLASQHHDDVFAAAQGLVVNL